MTDNIMRKLTRLSQQFQELRDRVEVSTGGGAAPSGWTDDGTVVRLTTSTDKVGVGTDTPAAKLQITGGADERQLLARANPSQTANIAEIQDSAGNDLSGMDSRGIIFSHGDIGSSGGQVTNFFAGFSAGNAGATGNNNVGIGSRALTSMTSAESNFALGSNALRDNTTGGNNVAVGVNALIVNVDGTNSVAIGTSALSSATTTDRNVAIGNGSTLALTTGNKNTAIGANTLAGSNSNEQVAVGNNALQLTTTGGYNTAIGASALVLNTLGSYNVAVGRNTGLSQTTGSNNIYIGSNQYGVAGESHILRIHNATTNTTTPLIYGEFNNKLIKINGSLSAIGQSDAVQLVTQANATQTANTVEVRDSAGTVMTAIAKNGAWKPPSLADTAAENNTVYYSTTQSKLVYKDPAGTVNDLY